MGYLKRGLFIDDHPREVTESDGRRQKLKVVYRSGLIDSKGTDSNPSEVTKVGASPQCDAKVGGQYTDVGAG